VAEYFKLLPGQSVDILHKKERRRRSYASLIVKAEKQKSMIDIIVKLMNTNLHVILLLSQCLPGWKDVQANQEYPD
jgi:hypothetical protein